ncbi:MAG TPA: hypothetical protein VKN14_06340 [Flavobacteriaceae bacterium]|nr:hypothetical protein [Flavobacteriaceae bacterium]
MRRTIEIYTWCYEPENGSMECYPSDGSDWIDFSMTPEHYERVSDRLLKKKHVPLFGEILLVHKERDWSDGDDEIISHDKLKKELDWKI